MAPAPPDMPDGPAPHPNGPPEPTIPAELLAALEAAPAAGERFAALPRQYRREYARWVMDARRADVRERRAAQTVMRLLEHH